MTGRYWPRMLPVMKPLAQVIPLHKPGPVRVPPSPPEPKRGVGRAWINGREVGGTPSWLRHLSESYD
jgi:hypothetical protein